MTNNLENQTLLRSYLLGRVTDENTLSELESRLFTDKILFNELERIEDKLIEEYSYGWLDEGELKDFEKLFLTIPERIEKMNFDKTLISIVKNEPLSDFGEKDNQGYFGNLRFSIRFAAVFSTICILLAFGCWWLFKKDVSDNKANNELIALYKDNRPVESRIAGFEYAPFRVLRGEENTGNNGKINTKIELDLIRQAEEQPNDKTLNNLCVFYLTERKFETAIENCEKAIEKNPENAEARADLGAALFEKAKSPQTENETIILERSLTQLNKSLEINKTEYEARFNKALVLEKLNRNEEAIIVWQEYLHNDADSKWAIEARENLEKLEGKK